MSNTLYRQQILDHYKHPQNFGTIEDAQAHAHEVNPLCGDEIDIYINFDPKGMVIDIKFSGTGCALSMASASMMTEELKGRTKDDLAEFDYDAMIRILGIEVSPGRIRCVQLPLIALHNALSVWNQ